MNENTMAVLGFVCTTVALMSVASCTAIDGLYGQSYKQSAEQRCADSDKARGSAFCLELARNHSR